MSRIRQQLSLFVPENQRATVELVRAIVDPVQHRLIPAHVTLCREDELSDIETIIKRLRTLKLPSLQLSFTAPERFYEHGLLMPCVAGLDTFRDLRKSILAIPDIREQTPHLTLAHPRNPKAQGNCLHNTAALGAGVVITFSAIYWIEQYCNEPWQILDCFALQRS
jgi:hypothetical protein